MHVITTLNYKWRQNELVHPVLALVRYIPLHGSHANRGHAYWHDFKVLECAFYHNKTTSYDVLLIIIIIATPPHSHVTNNE